MKEIKNTEPEITPTVQATMKKTHYGLWFGLAFALIMGVSFFGLQLMYSFRGPGSPSAGLQIFYSTLGPISHILYIPSGLEERGWIHTVGFFLAMASEKTPVLFMIYPVVPILVYFLIGALIGKIYGKVKSNPTTFAIFLLIIGCFVTYRLFIYKQKYYPSQSKDCMIYSTEFEQGACISQLAREKKDVSMCKDVPAGSNYERDCYSMVAIEVREYGVCEHMKFGEEFSYPHKTACRDNIALVRSECDKISTPEGRDACYYHTSQSIQQYAKQDACQRFKEVLGLKHLIQKCEDFRLGKITTTDTCEKIEDENARNQCVTSTVAGTIMFGPEKPEPVEGLYGPGTPETEEEIRNRPKPKEEDVLVVSEASIEQDTQDIVTETLKEIPENTTCHDTDGGLQTARKGNLYVDNTLGLLTDTCQRKTGANSYESTESCGGESCFIEETNCESPSKSYRTFPADYIACSEGCQNGMCRESKEKKKQIVACNNLFQEQDENYDFWKNKIEGLFPKLYINMVGAYCVMNDGGHLISIAYSSVTSENKQMIIKFDKYGEMVTKTDLIDCRFDSPNYFRFQDEIGENINIICENNFWRGTNGAADKKIVSKTAYVLNMETLQTKVISQE